MLIGFILVALAIIYNVVVAAVPEQKPEVLHEAPPSNITEYPRELTTVPIEPNPELTPWVGYKETFEPPYCWVQPYGSDLWYPCGMAPGQEKDIPHHEQRK